MSLKEARSKELSKYGWNKDVGWSDQWLKTKQLVGVSGHAFSEKGMLLAKDLSRRNKTSVKAMVAKAVQKRMLKLRSSLGSGLH